MIMDKAFALNMNMDTDMDMDTETDRGTDLVGHYKLSRFLRVVYFGI
jgi:hypothetical protein